jgi:hypothetical protein
MGNEHTLCLYLCIACELGRERARESAHGGVSINAAACLYSFGSRAELNACSNTRRARELGPV